MEDADSDVPARNLARDGVAADLLTSRMAAHETAAWMLAATIGR